VPATQADLGGGVPSLSPLPDGTFALLLGSGRAYTIGYDGVLRALPQIVEKGRIVRISELTARPDGSLFAVTRSDRTVYRLALGSLSWEPYFALNGIPRWDKYAAVVGVVGLADGIVIDAWDYGSWRVSDAGRVERVRLPSHGGSASLLGLPDGRLAAWVTDDLIRLRDRVIELRPDGTRSTLLTFPIPPRTPATLVGTPDGGFLRARELLERIRPDGSIEALGGERPGLGTGDGGSLADALLSVEDLAPLPDGSLLMSGHMPLAGPRTHMDLRAELVRGRLLTDVYGDGEPVVRAVVGASVQRPLVAIAPMTYTTLADGRVTFVSTFAGHAKLRVTRDRHTIATVEGAVVAGRNDMILPSMPPQASLRLTLTVVADDGRTSSAHLAATTQHRLPTSRALRLLQRFASSEGDSEAYRETRVGRCRRASRTRIDCRAIDAFGGPGLKERRRCAAVLTAVLRPDGVRGFRHRSKKECRAI